MEPYGWPTNQLITRPSPGTRSMPPNTKTAHGAPRFSRDSSTAGSGNHTLQSVAHDAAGNNGTSASMTVSITGVVVSSPTVTITSPSNGSTVPHNSAQTISAAASDSVGVQKVEFYVNGSLM